MSVLQQNFTALSPGYVLNVSNMDLNTGSGARRQIAPTGYGITKFLYSPGMPIISARLDTYLAAIQLIFGNEGFASQQQHIRNVIASAAANPTVNMPQLTTSMTRPVSPTQTRPISPRVSPTQIVAVPRPASPVMPRQISPIMPRQISPRLQMTPVQSPSLSPTNLFDKFTVQIDADTLRNRIPAASSGRVLDVSSMNLSTGTGARLVPTPRTNRAGRIGISGLGFISNNYEKYLLVGRLLYGPDFERIYEDDLAQLRAENPNW